MLVKQEGTWVSPGMNPMVCEWTRISTSTSRSTERSRMRVSRGNITSAVSKASTACLGSGRQAVVPVTVKEVQRRASLMAKERHSVHVVDIRKEKAVSELPSAPNVKISSRISFGRLSM